MKNIKPWTDKEIEYLQKNYSDYDLSKISKNLKRSISSITNKAFVMGLENRNRKFSKLNKLLEDTNEAYYWIGFLMADGHFSKNNQIQINLSKNDFHHLKKLANYIEYSKKLIKPSLYVSDKEVVSSLKERFNLDNNKTYKPPIINIGKEERLFSLIIGFIDGDGNIDKNGYLRIKVHKNWYSVIDFMMKNLVGTGNYNISIDSKNLVTGSVTKIELTKKIKERVEKLYLPILERKWKKIDIKKLSKKEKRLKMDSECFRFFNKGCEPKKVIKETGLSKSFVYNSKKRWSSKLIDE